MARCGGEVPALLIGEEDGHETQSYGEADSNGDTDVIAAGEAVHEQGDARASNDAINEGDRALQLVRMLCGRPT